MNRLRTFFRNNVLLLVSFAVAIPLLCLLALQYWSLLRLEETSTVAQQVWMKNYLNDVVKEVKYSYRANAEQVLNIPFHSITGDNLYKSKYHFGKCEVEGAKRLFLAAFDERGEARFLFFNPSDQSRLVEAPIEEARAVHVASAPFRHLSREKTPVTPTLSTDERDPDNRIIIKPITDDASRVVGAAGIILDTAYFRDQFLPQAIRNSLRKFFPDKKQDNVIVFVHDSRGNVVFSTQPVKGQNDETMVTIPYFTDWKLGIRSRHMTPEQWAHWNFNFDLTLSLLLTITLVGGIALALRTASRELKLSQMKTNFVSNVSHELRTPLSSIRVFGEFLKLGRVKDEEKIREYGEYIETESRRLTQLINNILDFSRIEANRKTFNFEQASVEEVIAETLKTFGFQLKQKGFHIVFEPPAKPLPPALIDADAIAQAFTNLLDNAVKYSGSSKEIQVRLDLKDNFITVAVTDHGIGIPREEQAKIFEKFYRVNTGLVHDVKGSGLGLSLVKHIIDAHHGRVTVQSKTGWGSTFTIYLPALPMAEARIQAQEVVSDVTAKQSPA